MFICVNNCLRYNIQTFFLSVSFQYFAKLSSLSANETSSRCPKEKAPADFTSKANEFKLLVRIKLKQLHLYKMFLCVKNCLRYKILSFFLSVSCQYFAKLTSLSANETSSRCPKEKAPADFTSKANEFKLLVRIKLKQLHLYKMFLCVKNCLRYKILSFFLSVSCQYFAKLTSLSANETSSRCPKEKAPADFTSKANEFKLLVKIKLKQLHL